jgi:para-nitrobenzyl esterase
MLYLKGAFDDEPEKYPQEKRVSDLMQQYWVNFAKTGGNPNGDNLPNWPEFEENKETVMQFKNGASLTALPNREKITLIDSFMKNLIKREENK